MKNITVALSDEDHQLVEQILSRRGLRSKSLVIKQALNLLRFVENQDGHLVLERNEERREVVLV